MRFLRSMIIDFLSTPCMNVLSGQCSDDFNEDFRFDFQISFHDSHVDYLVSNLPDGDPSSEDRNASW